MRQWSVGCFVRHVRVLCSLVYGVGGEGACFSAFGFFSLATGEQNDLAIERLWAAGMIVVLRGLRAVQDFVGDSVEVMVLNAVPYPHTAVWWRAVIWRL